MLGKIYLYLKRIKTKKVVLFFFKRDLTAGITNNLNLGLVLYSSFRGDLKNRDWVLSH